MNRRDFMKGVFAGGVGGAIAVGAPWVGVSISSKDEQGRALDRFVREISEYDILHFGEVHSTGLTTDTTTLEDFIKLFLPRLRDAKLTGTPYNILRTEYLPAEIDETGKQVISDEELANFDATGNITNWRETPTFYNLVLGSGACADSYGAIKLAREAFLQEYCIRGLFPTPELGEKLKKQVMEESKDFTKEQRDALMSLMSMRLITDIYKKAVKKEIKNYIHKLEVDEALGRKGDEFRMVLYGGAIHNDNTTEAELEDDFGIGGLHSKIYPNHKKAYAAIDLVKASFRDSDNMHVKRYQNILMNHHTSVKDPYDIFRLTILKREKDNIANYIVFFPNEGMLKTKEFLRSLK